MALLTQWTWVEWTPGVGDGQGGLVCCDSWGHKESDVTELNWTEGDIGVTNPTAMIISQHIKISNHAEHLKLIQCYMSITSQWSWKKNKGIWNGHVEIKQNYSHTQNVCFPENENKTKHENQQDYQVNLPRSLATRHISLMCQLQTLRKWNWKATLLTRA